MTIPGTDSEIISRSILVVEDHESTAQIMQQFLTRHGHRVWTANSCNEAKEVTQAHPVEVLVCDLGLPDGDGCDLLQDIRKIKPMKAIVLSGHDGKEDREKSRKAGFDAHLSKPLDVTELERTIFEVFQRNTVK